MLAKVNVVHVPYKGSSQVSTALLSGEVTLALINPISILGQIQHGKLRVLAVSTAERSSLLPRVPTLAEAGLAGYEITHPLQRNSQLGLDSPHRERQAWRRVQIMESQ